ncbi:hypothetical protein Vadar_029040 [Vaccinium darrowii]|uniref:Uncharacterized protein n=1 Tax=Vaccinium darrowii TaxID=229202 RepID=A0ACB7ZNC3_9ERIC|nr:hypothetical protein Vadar_029040 [Vaccinium darrowii]
MATGEQNSHPAIQLLPPEIMAQILSRLPVKSLLRFRCVSKSWRALISDPEFAKTHLRLASSIDTAYTHHRLLIANAFAVVRSCSLPSILNENCCYDADVVDIDHYPMCRDNRGGHLGVRVLGCCDGLMCIETKTTLFVWNPSTRKSKRLPSYDMPLGHVVVYGFGYDASIDDYKVVGFLYECRDGIFYGAKVCTLRSDSWRRIGDFPRCDITFKNRSGVFANGALHWNARETDGNIVSLDLAKETYGEVSKPNKDRAHGHLYETLCDFHGCLGVLYDYRAYADVWVMKEYGTRESWTKLVVISFDTSSDLKYTIPVCILKNGEILLDTNKRLVRYNPKDGTFTYPTSPIDLGSSAVHPYVESLVSVEMDADIGVPWLHKY